MASPSQQQSARRQSDGIAASPVHSHSSSSLAAAAAMNAGLRSEERNPSHGDASQSQSIDRRRSSVRMSLAMNDPSLPAPGELAASPAAASRRLSSSLNGPPSPERHIRAPSLGELHQELENEQEAQVNRLLGMIRRQQQQIDQMQLHQPSSSMAIDDSNPPSDVSRSQTPNPSNSSRRQTSAMSQALAVSTGHSHSHSHSPSPSLRAQRSFSHQTGTEEFPALSHASSGPNTTSARDESAFYQAETQSLTRENQMLKSRIRELERQIAEQDDPVGHDIHSPVRQSSLHTAPVQEQ